MGCGASSQPIEESSQPIEGKAAPIPVPTPAIPLAAAPPLDETNRRDSTDPPFLPDDKAFDMMPGMSINEEEDFQCIDMDAPGSRKAFVSQPTSPLFPLSPTAAKLGVKGQSKRRFRKRSVNLHPLPDEQLKLVRESFDLADPASTGFITRDALKTMLKQNYQPSEAETLRVLRWFDLTGTGKVEFSEYAIAMASVMTQAGIGKEAGIEEAREALSFEMQRMNVSITKSRAGGAEELPSFNLDNTEHAFEIVGEANLDKMKTRWESLDIEKRGYLELDQIRELIRLTYVPPAATVESFCRVFTTTADHGISRHDFEQGMTLLYGDFSYAFSQSSVRLVSSGNLDNAKS